MQLGPSVIGSREGIIRWVTEEEVDSVHDGVDTVSVRPFMCNDDGVGGRIKGHEDCGRRMLVSVRAEDP